MENINLTKEQTETLFANIRKMKSIIESQNKNIKTLVSIINDNTDSFISISNRVDNKETHKEAIEALENIYKKLSEDSINEIHNSI